MLHGQVYISSYLKYYHVRTPQRFRLFGCAGPLNAILCASTTAFDALVFTLTLKQAFPLLRMRKALGMYESLAEVILRDGEGDFGWLRSRG